MNSFASATRLLVLGSEAVQPVGFDCLSQRDLRGLLFLSHIFRMYILQKSADHKDNEINEGSSEGKANHQYEDKICEHRLQNSFLLMVSVYHWQGITSTKYHATMGCK